MRNFSVITLFLLYSLSWICVSVSDFDDVDVQSGQQVTLLCSNFSSSPTHIIWFRVVKKLKPHCVCFFYTSSEPASFCEGFKNSRYEATTNVSTLFLTIKQVDLSDAGLYFCGFYSQKHTVIVSATYLEVPEVFVKPVGLILGGLIVCLAIVIIGLVVKVKWLQKAHMEEQNPHQTESRDSDELNYAAVTFRAKTETNLRSTLERKMEPNAIYSSTK
ncbi:hypothetical protein Q5P01_000036 [Channa striata]|uniref:Ig-like domain-containing protein n=1 Tax=Channa striata TaxID=64152 RepID=A0AA88IHI9_CHASR|nr:hypothetical protein Q5P01_000036 [Channa striata]